MSPRALRADAARNRELLLSAAEEELTDRGLEVSIADIARRAGVAKSTAFSHFATREQLVSAVVVRSVAALVEAARADTTDDPGEALWRFLTVAADRRRQRDLTFLTAMTEGDAEVVRVRDELHAAIAALVERAQRARALRDDVTATDIFLLLCAPVHVVENLPGAAPDLWRRYLGIIVDGLRPDGASALSEPAPSWT